MEDKKLGMIGCIGDDYARSILHAYYNGLKCPVEIKKYNNGHVMLSEEEANNLLELAKNEYPVLRYFTDSFLLSSSVELFGWRILYHNYKYIDSAVLNEMLAAPYAETVVLLISAYEYNKNKNNDFSIMDFHKIGRDKAKKILNTFYEHSNGKYDPEPGLRRELNNGR